MQRPALVLMLIVSLLLPSFGSMAVAMPAMPAEPCSMQGESQHAQTPVETPCCEDMDQGLSSKSHCKSGHECKTGSLLHITLIKVLPPLVSPHLVVFSESLVQRAPAPLWRPPRVC